MKVSTDINENIKYLENKFLDSGDVAKRKFQIGKDKITDIYVTYIDMLVDRNLLEEQVISRLMINMWTIETELNSGYSKPYNVFKDCGLTTAEFSEVTNLSDVEIGILSGDTALFIDGSDKAIVIATRGWPSRGVPTADNEQVVQGSAEAFSEAFRINTMLIRRRIRDTNLKVKQLRIGRKSNTDTAIMYLEGIVRPSILKEVEKRINRIDIDAILDIGYIDQLIHKQWLTPFPLGEITQRPDKASAAILEGRIVIVVDNSPFCLILPCTLNTFFQSSEDYYQNFEIMSFVRFIRYIAGILSVTLPGLYLLMATFHPSMIPTELILKMSAARKDVPFPALVEILLMEFTFELLREAGIRLPGVIGGTMGIIGGIILGQAAVEAGLVSPIVVIVIAVTGVCGFAIPNISLVNGFKICKFFILFGSAFLGLYGFWICCFIILTHLCSIKDFGIPYMFPYCSTELNNYNDLKDSIFRFPLFFMKNRPIFANPKNSKKVGASTENIIRDKE